MAQRKPAKPVNVSLRESELRRDLVLALAPVFVREFFSAGDAWPDYPDLADSLERCADEIARRSCR